MDNSELNNTFGVELTNALATVDKFINKNYLSDLSDCPVVALSDDYKKSGRIRLFRIDRIVFDEEEDANDKLISIYSAVQNFNASVVLLVKGNGAGIEYYIGIVGADDDVIIPADTLCKSFSANFPGSVLENTTTPEIIELLNNATYKGESCNVTSVTLIPSAREDKSKNNKQFVQGLEKFIDTMNSENYTALFISKPVDKTKMESRKRGLEQIYSALSPFSKTTFAYGDNESEAVSEGYFENFSKSISTSVSTTIGTNYSTNETTNKGSSMGFNLGFSFGSNKGKSTGTSEAQSKSGTNAENIGEVEGGGKNNNTTITKGSSKTITIEAINKTVDVLLKILEKHISRIDDCESFGMWETAAYFIAEDVEVSVVAANSFKALVSGDSSNVENAYINRWNQVNENTDKIIEYLKYCLHPVLQIPSESSFSQSQQVTPVSLVSGKELPLFMGLPQKSVNGVAVTTMAEFCRNVIYKDESTISDNSKKVSLGCIHHMGVDDTGNLVNLNLDSFSSHCFITGSTGSGKSTTSYKMLDCFINNKIPFLVIEPAKGEYKNDFGAVDGINIFTTNPYMGAMLKINPFKFNENIHILEHLDRLVEIFNACWEMYAAMPAILKSAVEKAYTDMGWDLLNSVYTKPEKPQFPTFSDVLRCLPEIINSTNYSSQSKGDYTGALVTRVESLTNGITGQIFCDTYSIDEKTLFDQNTIVDLSRIGSTETKSLIMGILVMQLTEYRMATSTGSNKSLMHVTVLEEAHNLLKNVSQAQNQSTANLVGKSVEMICNSIAEMRTYGEGFLIIDQSPSSVDIAAIKNTNTKIIMRLPEKEDCEAVGNAIGLKEIQIKELSKLPVGVSAVMQNNWLEAVLCKVNNDSHKKYYKQTETCTFAQIKNFRSIVINNLILQIINKNADISAMNRIIDAVDIPEYAKTEMKKRLAEFFKDYSEEPRQRHLCDMLFNLSGVSSIFKVNESMILGKENDSETVSSWKNAMMDSIRYLISMNSEYNYEYLFKRLLYSLTLHSDSTKVKYKNIFMALYNKKEDIT